MALTDIMDGAVSLIGIPKPSFFVSSQDTTAKQLLALAQLAGDTLMQDHTWGNLIKRNTFNENASLDDFDRFYPASGIWDVNAAKPILGPLNQEEWNALLVRNITGGDKYWTRYQGAIYIYPDPDATDQFTFSYITTNWIRPTDGPDVSEWSADTDAALVPEQLVKLSIVWRWKQSKGLDYAEDMSTFERTRERLMARDRGPRNITTTRWFRGDDWMDNFWPGQIETSG